MNIFFVVAVVVIVIVITVHVINGNDNSNDGKTSFLVMKGSWRETRA